MKLLNYVFFGLILGLTFACKKIEPPVDQNEANAPIYSLEGIVNGKELKLNVDDKTVFISDGPYNMNGIEAHSSTITDSQTNFDLKVIVLKSEILLDETGLQSITNKATNFIVHKPICKTFNFSGSSNQSDYTNINIEGKNFSGNEVNINNYGIYNVEFNFNNIGIKKHTIPVEFGFKNEKLVPIFEVIGSSNTLYFESNNLVVSHKWYLDGTEISQNAKDNIVINKGIHILKHSVTDQFLNTASYSTLLNMQDNLVWTINQSYCSPGIIENNFGKVILESNFEGDFYTSVYNLTNLNKNFIISNIETITDSENQTINFVKFNISFDVELKTLDHSKTLILNQMKGTFHIKIK